MTTDVREIVARLKGHSEIMERDKGKFVRFIDVATCAEAVGLIEAQAAEIARLREVIKTQANAVRTLHNNEATEINRLRKQRHEWHLAVTSIDSEREANAILTAEIERLLEALEFYADPEMWTPHKHANAPIDIDAGKIARAARDNFLGSLDVKMTVLET